jgi:hypothetical protein
MKCLFKLLAFCVYFISFSSFSQERGSFSLEANYGLQTNFFVNSYNEDNPFAASFLNKNMLGTIGGLNVRYHFNRKSAIFLAFDKSENTKEVNFNEIITGVEYFINDFHLRHINHFFQLGYEHSVQAKKSKWNFSGGLVYLRPFQQEIDITALPPGIVIEERNFKSYGLEEGGVFIGIQHSWPIDNHFELGIRTKVFYLISVNTLEAITLTPTLTYTFHKKK